jgi:catechol-2,3-dioxygenase
MPLHGNAWSLYYKDPEGNGLECFVDTPFHVAQPVAAEEFDLDLSDEDIEAWTRKLCQSGGDFQPMSQWRESFVARLKKSL